MKLLENKVAIVTGASRGIGEAVALKLAEHGAHVAFSYLSSEEKAKALEEKLKAIIPSYGHSLIENPDLAHKTRAATAEILNLQNVLV